MEFVGTTRISKQYIMDAYQFNGLSKLLCLPPATLRRCIAIALTTTAVLPLLACTQNLNWRVVQLANLRTMLPCKPEQASRPIALGDQTVTMDMMGCEVDKALFTVSHIQDTHAADVAQAAGLLIPLRAASLASVAAHRISPAANTAPIPPPIAGTHSTAWMYRWTEPGPRAPRCKPASSGCSRASTSISWRCMQIT